MSSSKGCCGWKDLCWGILCDENEEKVKAAYGYIYLLKEGKAIDIEARGAIPFNRDGELNGIIHNTATNRDTITIEEMGIYEVSYYFDNNAKQVLAIELEGSEVPGSRYSTETASSIVYGQVIIKVTKKNTALKLVNEDKKTTIDKLDNTEDLNIVVSSIFIEKIDEIKDNQ